jgi:Domain of Unknown Function with PDB structure (DUF3857)
MLSSRNLLLPLLVLVFIVPLRAEEPWNAPFAPNSKAILDTASHISVSDSQPVLILLEQHEITIDSAGRITSKLRKVYRIATSDALEDWAAVEQEFQPWHENKPEVRSRVIAPDGNVHWLEPKTISDSPAEEFDQTMFSDRRLVRAPLPAIVVGSVVEYEVTIQENAPILDVGESRRIVIDDSLPVQRFRFSISAAKNIPLKIVSKINTGFYNSP